MKSIYKGESILKTVAFVPVKLNNQRMPGKNTKCFDDGTPLITFFLRTLVTVHEFDEVYVFCSDETIKDYLIDGVIFCQRPEYLDLQTATPQDIISEFMNRVCAEIYAVCHCTSPFVTRDHISECVKKVKDDGYDSAFLGEKIQRLLWSMERKPVNFNPSNIPRTQDLDPVFTEVSAAYVFRRETFINLRRRIGTNPYMCEVSGIEAVDIDYPEDFDIANAIYMKALKEREDN